MARRPLGLPRLRERGRVAGVGGDGQQATVGVGMGKVMRLASGSYACAMADLGEKSMAYTRGGIAEVAFNNEDRARATGGSTG